MLKGVEEQSDKLSQQRDRCVSTCSENLLSYYKEGEFLFYPSWAWLVHAVKRMEPKLLVSFTLPCSQVTVSKELSHLVPVTAHQGSPRANFGMTPVVLTCYLHVWQINILDLNVY